MSMPWLQFCSKQVIFLVLLLSVICIISLAAKVHVAAKNYEARFAVSFGSLGELPKSLRLISQISTVSIMETSKIYWETHRWNDNQPLKNSVEFKWSARLINGWLALSEFVFGNKSPSGYGPCSLGHVHPGHGQRQLHQIRRQNFMTFYLLRLLAFM